MMTVNKERHTFFLVLVLKVRGVEWVAVENEPFNHVLPFEVRLKVVGELGLKLGDILSYLCGDKARKAILQQNLIYLSDLFLYLV